MSKLNLIYLASLVLLGAVLVLVVAGPIAKQGQTNPLQRAQLLEREDQWILELNLINPKDRPVEYLLRFSGPGGDYEDPVSLPPGATYTHIHHFYRQDFPSGAEALVELYQEGQAEPVERLTYFLRGKE